ncbi:MAG: mycofactocin biosynthesis glycosyltransferase MftF [Rhodospirillales bacterium]
MPGHPGAASYKLQPGLLLLPTPSGAGTTDGGGVLLSPWPLMAMALNRNAFALLAALSIPHGPTRGMTAEAAAAAAGLPPADASAFLDRLAHRRLLVCTPLPPRQWPDVSIIVPARGRHRATRACVQSLLALDYPAEACEIIVVDDASEPPLAPALDGLPIRTIRLQRNAGQSVARNLAAVEARGELLAFIDNDCIAAADWLRVLVPHFGDAQLAIVGGRVVAPPPTGGTVGAFEAVRSPLDMGAMAAPVGPTEPVAYLATCNFIVRRDVLLAEGGFVEEMRLGEDVDFTWRVLRAGHAARYVPAGQVTHCHREGLLQLLQRRADYASSEADLQRRHPEGRRVLPVPRLGLLALTALTVLFPAPTAVIALGLLIAVLAGVEIGSKQRRLRRLGVALPIARVAAAVAREHLASLHRLSANVLRYYGLPLLALGLLWPGLWPAIAVVFVLAPLLDHGRLKPACGLPAFALLSWLEMAAYQWGVWRGCIVGRTVRPLLPILHWKR